MVLLITNMAFVGLDIGTNNCCCYIIKEQPNTDVCIPELVPSQLGHHLTPSMVAYTSTDILTGELAQQQQQANPNNTFYEFKRVLGRSFEAQQLAKDAKHWPFNLVRRQDGTPQYVTNHKNTTLLLTATQLYQNLADHMARLIKQHASTVYNLVVTVPAHFDHNQRRETLSVLKATNIAPAIHVCNEPTAAAAAYAERDHNIQPGESILVFDLGAGTLDVTVLETLSDGTFSILGSKGADDLGGADFDRHVLHHYSLFYKKETKAVLHNHKTRLVMARQACEQAKKILSLAESASVALPDVPVWSFTRDQFNHWIAHDLERCAAVVDEVLILTNQSDIKHLILVGGSTRVLAVKELLSNLFPNSQQHSSINVDECVALGASYLAKALHNTDVVSQERLSKDLGIRTMTNTMHTLVAANTVLPAKASQKLFPQHNKQKTVEIAIFQGDDPCTDHNALLGTVRLTGLRPGQPGVLLQMTVKQDGCVEVSVEDDDGHKVESVVRL